MRHPYATEPPFPPARPGYRAARRHTANLPSYTPPRERRRPGPPHPHSPPLRAALVTNPPPHGRQPSLRSRSPNDRHNTGARIYAGGAMCLTSSALPHPLLLTALSAAAGPKAADKLAPEGTTAPTTLPATLSSPPRATMRARARRAKPPRAPLHPAAPPRPKSLSYIRSTQEHGYPPSHTQLRARPSALPNPLATTNHTRNTRPLSLPRTPERPCHPRAPTAQEPQPTETTHTVHHPRLHHSHTLAALSPRPSPQRRILHHTVLGPSLSRGTTLSLANTPGSSAPPAARARRTDCSTRC